MLHRAFDDGHKGHIKSGFPQALQRHIENTGAVRRVAGHTYDTGTVSGELRHDVAYVLPGIFFLLPQQIGGTFRDPSGEGMEHNRQMFLISARFRPAEYFSEEVIPGIRTETADDAYR